MKTRTLILLAVACGLAILVAGVAFFIRIATHKDELTVPEIRAPGQSQQVGDVTATVTGSASTVDGLFVVQVRLDAAKAVPDAGIGWSLVVERRHDAAPPVAVPSGAGLRRAPARRSPPAAPSTAPWRSRPATATATWRTPRRRPAAVARLIRRYPELSENRAGGGPDGRAVRPRRDRRGPGGYAAALYAASAGLSVAVVEKDKVGGTCLHRGCIPAKEFLETAAVYRHVAGAKEFGIEAGQPVVDFAVSQARKQRVVDGIWSRACRAA